MSTVVVQQPTLMTVTKNTEWSSGLCQCCVDMNSCCFAFWCCPCFACSTTAEFGECMCLPLIDILGPGLLALCGIGMCAPPVSLSMRVAVRNKYGITGSLIEDILISCFCISCSWCQIHREIKQRNNPAMVMSTQTVTMTSPIITANVMPGAVVTMT